MDLSGYLIAWGAYLMASLGLIVVIWRLTRSWQRFIKRAVRAFFVVFFFTPINIVDAEIWFAPAYLVAVYDWIQGSVERAALAFQYMAAAYALVVALILLESVFRRLFHLEKA